MPSIADKPLMAEDMASEFRLPIIRIIEGSGGGGSVKTIETTGASNLPGGIGSHARLLVHDRQPGRRCRWSALGLGSVAGPGRGAAGRQPLLGDDQATSAMFVAGPPVVARLGQDLDKQELGGAEIQTPRGAVDHAVDTEEEAFECARRFLSYLPPSVHDAAAGADRDDDPERARGDRC